MANKLTSETFLATVKQSGLVEQEQLKKFWQAYKQRGENLEDSRAVADELVDLNLVTRWQVDKLLLGKHKGFFLGKYRLLSHLGTGGMSSVYLAEHVLMRRRVAIKVLPQSRVEDTSYLERFHREAQAVASLDHANIVRAYDVDKENNVHFLVMEYVTGQSFQELVLANGPMDFVSIADNLRQASDGLSHAHVAGMVHRDIKPGNLLVDKKGIVKLLDLGLAMFFDDKDENPLTIRHDEKVLGTADYLSPEQALDSHTVDARADIYSLGCTGYFLLTGHPPFPEGTLAQRLMAHQTKLPAPIEKDRPDTPPSLLAIIYKMMAKKPDDRYQTAKDTALAWTQWLVENAGPEWREKHPYLASLGGSAFAQQPAAVAPQTPTPSVPAKSDSRVVKAAAPKVNPASETESGTVPTKVPLAKVAAATSRPQKPASTTSAVAKIAAGKSGPAKPVPPSPAAPGPAMPIPPAAKPVVAKAVIANPATVKPVAAKVVTASPIQAEAIPAPLVASAPAEAPALPFDLAAVQAAPPVGDNDLADFFSSLEGGGGDAGGAAIMSRELAEIATAVCEPPGLPEVTLAGSSPTLLPAPAPAMGKTGKSGVVKPPPAVPPAVTASTNAENGDLSTGRVGVIAAKVATAKPVGNAVPTAPVLIPAEAPAQSVPVATPIAKPLVAAVVAKPVKAAVARVVTAPANPTPPPAIPTAAAVVPQAAVEAPLPSFLEGLTSAPTEEASAPWGTGFPGVGFPGADEVPAESQFPAFETLGEKVPAPAPAPALIPQPAEPAFGETPFAENAPEEAAFSDPFANFAASPSRPSQTPAAAVSPKRPAKKPGAGVSVQQILQKLQPLLANFFKQSAAVRFGVPVAAAAVIAWFAYGWLMPGPSATAPTASKSKTSAKQKATQTAKKRVKKPKAQPEVVEEAVVEPPPRAARKKPSGSLVKRELTVGPAGQYKTIREALADVTQQADTMKNARRAVQTIKIAGGQTYAERIVMGRGFPNGVHLIVENGEATLAPADPGPVIDIDGTGPDGIERLKLEGFTVQATGKEVGIRIQGFLKAAELKRITVNGFTKAGLEGVAPSSYSNDKITLDSLVFRAGAPQAAGMTLRAAAADATQWPAQLNITKCRFFGPMSAGIVVESSAMSLLISQGIFSDTSTGVKFTGNSPELRNIVLANNSFFKVKDGISFSQMPGAGSEGLGFYNNLFAEIQGPELLVEKDFKPAEFAATLSTDGAGAAYNWSQRPAAGANNDYSIFLNGGRQGVTDFQFASTDPNAANFLAPSPTSPQRASARVRESDIFKTFIGAVGP